MSWLLVPLLKNAILVVPLALIALGAGRWSRRPALAHLLWVLVLIKLVTPPLIDVPLGWRLDVETWLGLAPEKAAGEVAKAGLEGRPAATHHTRSTARNGMSTSRSRRQARDSVALATDASSANGRLSFLTAGAGRVQLIGFIWTFGSIVVAAG